MFFSFLAQRFGGVLSQGATVFWESLPWCQNETAPKWLWNAKFPYLGV